LSRPVPVSWAEAGAVEQPSTLAQKASVSVKERNPSGPGTPPYAATGSSMPCIPNTEIGRAGAQAAAVLRRMSPPTGTIPIRRPLNEQPRSSVRIPPLEIPVATTRMGSSPCSWPAESSSARTKATSSIPACCAGVEPPGTAQQLLFALLVALLVSLWKQDCEPVGIGHLRKVGDSTHLFGS